MFYPCHRQGPLQNHYLGNNSHNPRPDHNSPNTGKKRNNSRDSNSKAGTVSSSLYRWLTVYLPLLVVAGFILYVLSEIVMKHLAFRTIQQHLAHLPEVPTALPTLSTTAAAMASPLPHNFQTTNNVALPPLRLPSFQIPTASESLHSYVLNMSIHMCVCVW